MTMPQPIPFFPATSDFPSGTDTPRDLLERCLARFEEFEPGVGAFVCHDLGAARAAADLATKRWRAVRPMSAAALVTLDPGATKREIARSFPVRPWALSQARGA
jgi:hypothetical protein